jgi:ABC-2 type transport system permease protein
MKAFMQRTTWITWVTFLEAIRQRFFAFLIVLGGAMVLSSVAFRFMDFGHGELKFVADFGFGGMFLFGSVLGVVMTAQLFFSEIDNRTALTLLAKPVSRAEFLLGKFFGTWLVLAIFVFVLSSLLGAVLWSRSIELNELAEKMGRLAPEFSPGGLVAFALLQWLRLGVVIAIVLTIASGARTFLYAVVVGALAVVAGQLQWIAQDVLLKPEGSVWYRGVLWVTSRLLPNLEQFNIGDALVLDPTSVPANAVVQVAISGLIYMVAFLMLGTALFRRREI